MKSTAFLLFGLLILGLAPQSHAQLRTDEVNPYQWTGTIVRTQPPAQSGINLLERFNFRMSHSYEMSMGTMGGQTYNQNYYTNTMQMQFNDRLTGRLDVAFAHSPFGNGLMMNQGPQIFIRNAEINYQISPRTNFSFSFQQNQGYNRFNDRFYHGY